MRPRRRSTFALAGAALVGVLFGLTTPVAASAAPPDLCEAVAVLAFRGSGEPNLNPSITTNSGASNRYGSSDLVTNGWEGARLRGLFSELATITYADGFRADRIPVLGVGPADPGGLGYPAIEAWTEVFSQLNSSAIAGAEAAMQTMRQFSTGPAQGCTTETKFILAGYSQGAMAARLTAQLSPTNVIGVINIGDPYQMPNGAGNEGSKPDGNGFIRWNYPRLESTFDSFYNLEATKAAICHDGDPICDFRWGTAGKFVTNDFADHTDYYTGAHAREAPDKARQIADLAHNAWVSAQSAAPVARGSADVVFAIDTTGSMQPYIGQAVATAEAVASATLARSPNSRVSLVEYRDHGDEFVSRTVVPFTTNFSDLTVGLTALYADGGGDFPEAVFSGIVEGINQDWRAGVARSIIVIGDAPAHDPEPVTGYTGAIISGFLAAGSAQAGPMLRSAAAAEPTVQAPISLYVASAEGQLDGLAPIAEASGGRVLAMDNVDDLEDAIGTAIEETLDAPVALVIASEPAIAGSPVYISGTSSTAYDPDSLFEFDLDGDGTFETPSATGGSSVVFEESGTYSVSLRVTDSRARASVATTTFEVLPSEVVEPKFDPETPSVQVSADASVSQGEHVDVQVIGGLPEEYLIVHESGSVWGSDPVFTSPVPADWASRGLLVPSSVPPGAYRLVVGTDSGWGATDLAVLPADSDAGGGEQLDRGSVSLSSTVARPGDRVSVSVSGLDAKGEAVVWMYSEPVELGRFAIPADGSFIAEVQIPLDTSLGDHSIVVAAESVTLSAPISIVAAEPREPAAFAAGPGGALTVTGGGDATPWMAVAALLLAAGIALVIAGRRRMASRG